ncbi:hypothetical protein JCM3770_003757 [Rhodotorula araucariae]
MAPLVATTPANANEHLFDVVSFFISTTIRTEVRAALHDLLISWGATPCPPPPPASSSSPLPRPPRFDPARLTHFITDTLDFPEYDFLKHRLGSSGEEGDGAIRGVPKQHAKGKGKARDDDGAGGKVEVVTPAWVTRSFDLQALQPPRFFSADKALFFSGTVVCTSELPEADTLAIHSGVIALGGQTRRELTREVTHLICAAEHGQKYEMALKFGTELGIVVVLPHWFEESLKLSTLVPIDIYRFPAPPFSTSLRSPSVPSVPFATRLHDFWRRRLPTSISATETGPPASEPNTATAVILGLGRGGRPANGAAGEGREGDEAYFRSAVADAPLDDVPRRRGTRPFDGKRVYLASDLGLSAGLERALKARVRDAGGECWGFSASAEDGEEDDARRERRGNTVEREDAWAKRSKAEKRLKESDIVVLRTREGWEFWTAYDAHLTIGNLSYLFHCLATSSLPSPLSRLLHYPLPSLHGLPAWRGENIVMTVSNYAGPARDYVRALVEALGARFEGTMTKTTNYVVTASEFGSKVQHARAWHLPLVTHCWLEALLLEWRFIPPSLHPSYTLPASSVHGGGASATNFTALLGDTAYSRAGIERWAAQDEQVVARAEALRDVRELQREEEEQLARMGAVGEAAGAAPEWARDDGQGETAESARLDEVVGDSRPPELPRLKDEAMDVDEEPASLAPAPLPATPRLQLMIPEPAEPVAANEPSPTPPAPAPAPAPAKKAKEAKAKVTSKGKEREPLQPRRSATRESEAMDVDDVSDKPVPAPLKPGTPPRAAKKRGASKKPRARSSSPLSDVDGASGSDSDDKESLPPSARAMGKTYTLISDSNVVHAGSKRGAAARAQAALADQMSDRNAYEQELKSSGRKGAVVRRSRSPRKATQDKPESDGDEADEPEGMVKRGAKGNPKRAARQRDDAGDLDELSIDEAPRKKKAKSAAPTNKALRGVHASAAATTQEGGVVSSFDKPPNAKPTVPAPKKIKIISTGLGLDKSSADIKAMKPLGATWTERPSEATHLVVKGISRTEKFLCCLPFVPKIVNKGWIDACIAAGKLVDEAPYLVKDRKKEAEIGDTLEGILARARKGKLFGGRNVYVTRQVQPDSATMQRILQASGAVVHVKDLSKCIKQIANEPDALIISTPADRREWEKLAAAPYNRRIYSVEAVFSSVLHQDLDRGFVVENRVDPQLHDD